MKKDNFTFGCLIGLLPPAIAHVLTTSGTMGPFISNKPLSLYVIAALINLVVIRYGYRNGYQKSAQGVIFATFAATLMLLFTQQVSLS